MGIFSIFVINTVHFELPVILITGSSNWPLYYAWWGAKAWIKKYFAGNNSSEQYC